MLNRSVTQRRRRFLQTLRRLFIIWSDQGGLFIPGLLIKNKEVCNVQPYHHQDTSQWINNTRDCVGAWASLVVGVLLSIRSANFPRVGLARPEVEYTATVSKCWVCVPDFSKLNLLCIFTDRIVPNNTICLPTRIFKRVESGENQTLVAELLRNEYKTNYRIWFRHQRWTENNFANGFIKTLLRFVYM